MTKQEAVMSTYKGGTWRDGIEPIAITMDKVYLAMDAYAAAKDEEISRLKAENEQLIKMAQDSAAKEVIDKILEQRDWVWIGDMSNESLDKWLRILKETGEITLRDDGGEPFKIWLNIGELRYESNWHHWHHLNFVIDWVSTRGGLEFLSPPPTKI